MRYNCLWGGSTTTAPQCNNATGALFLELFYSNAPSNVNTLKHRWKCEKQSLSRCAHLKTRQPLHCLAPQKVYCEASESSQFFSHLIIWTLDNSNIFSVPFNLEWAFTALVFNQLLLHKYVWKPQFPFYLKQFSSEKIMHLRHFKHQHRTNNSGHSCVQSAFPFILQLPVEKKALCVYGCCQWWKRNCIFKSFMQ